MDPENNGTGDWWLAKGRWGEIKKLGNCKRTERDFGYYVLKKQVEVTNATEIGYIPNIELI